LFVVVVAMGCDGQLVVDEILYNENNNKDLENKVIRSGG